MAKAAPKAVDETEIAPTTRAKKSPSTKTKTKKKAPAKPAKAPEAPSRGAWIHEFCTITELSILLNLSVRALHDQNARGVLVRGAKAGTYRTIPSMEAYIGNLRLAASGRAKEVQSVAAEERGKIEKIERQIRELKLKELQGEILQLDEVSEAWSTFAGLVKQAFLTFPTKARAKIPHLTAHDQATLTTIAKDMLLDMAAEIRASVVGGDADVLKS
jgi:phage terminase Nu1 subunit (DNA packaging protein)